MADYSQPRTDEEIARVAALQERIAAGWRHCRPFTSGGGFYACPQCGAACDEDGMASHDKWHETMGRVARDAYWGGLNRPLGGS